MCRDCVTGMCGNANGIKENDRNTREGNPTTGTLPKRYMKVGNSYANQKTINAGKLVMLESIGQWQTTVTAHLKRKLLLLFAEHYLY